MKVTVSKCANQFVFAITVIAISSLSTATTAQGVKADHTTLDIEGFSKKELDAARALRI
ncbi:MAG: hypothetical protein GY854_02010, partial [Deltaproteobacteria bacterium]|nr:hypothetical protein [Deltaproteobacteria bacterium]